MISVSEREQIMGILGLGNLPSPSNSTPGIAETMPRKFPTSETFVPTSGTLYLFSIILGASRTITNINFVSGTTPETGGSHLWFTLYDANLNLLGQTPDNTVATVLTATTNFQQTLSTPVTTVYAGLYYVGFCIVATGMPSFINYATDATNIVGIAPITQGTSNTGLNTGTAPNPATALTAILQTVYGYVS